MLVCHQVLAPGPPTGLWILSFRAGELLAGVSGFRPSLPNANGRLLGPDSWARALCLSLVLRNLRASSEVKVTLEVATPRNLSHPGAPLAAMVAGDLLGVLEDEVSAPVCLSPSSSILSGGGGGRGVSSLTSWRSSS